MADNDEGASGVVSLEQHAAKKAAGAIRGMGSVHDVCTRKEAIDCAVNVARTTYDLIAKEHGDAMAELERQTWARCRAVELRLEARIAAVPRPWWAQLRGWWARRYPLAPTQPPPGLGGPSVGELGNPGLTVVPPVREFDEWGPDSDRWLAVGRAAVGPDYLHPGPDFRRLRCRSTAQLRAFAEALGGDPAGIEDGETSKAVEGEVLADLRRLMAGETLARKDTKPEAVP